MRYLAEVQKTGMIGGKTQLKLLAYQQGEHKWNVLSKEEVIATEAANEFKAGVLVLVDLSENKQVKQIQNAARPLVGILQSYSGLEKKIKLQQEDLELWEHTKTYSKQEFERRRAELQIREQKFNEQKEEFKQKLEQQHQQLMAMREALCKLWDQVENDRRQLVGTLLHQ